MPGAFPLLRPVASLAQPLDLLVVGGGIYGAWTAYDAAARGLRVAVIEARDWGAGTSSASSKLIHGGLRYLEQFEFALVHQALHERQVLARVASHLVRPLRFLLPVWRDSRASRVKLEAGLTLYDLMAGPRQPVGRHRRLHRAALLRRRPELDEKDLLGGFDYGDCQEDDARLTLEVIGAAQAAGAACISRMRAVAIGAVEHGGVCVSLHDEIAGTSMQAQARSVVLAAGPWSSRLTGAQAPPVKLIKGVHLVLPALPGRRDALLLTAPKDHRVFFVIPWYGRTLVGTTEAEVSDASDVRVEDAERDYLLAAAAARMPGLGWRAADVIASFCGVRMLQDDHALDLSAVTREFELREIRPGVWLPIGGKYTTSRYDAAHIVDRVAASQHRELPRSMTSRRLLPSTPPGKSAAWQAQAGAALRGCGIDAGAVDSLLHRYGTRVARIESLVRESPKRALRIVGDLPFIGAEVILACRDEVALEREDVVRRRLPLALLSPEAEWAARIEQLLDEA